MEKFDVVVFRTDREGKITHGGLDLREKKGAACFKLSI